MFLGNYQFYRKSGNNANSMKRVGSRSLRHYDAMHVKINMRFTLKKNISSIASYLSF